MLKGSNKINILKAMLAGVFVVSTFGTVLAEMISPIDAGVIIKHMLQQKKNEDFEQSLVDLDRKNIEHQAKTMKVKGIILTAEDTKALEDVKNCFDEKQYNAVISIATQALERNPDLYELILYRGEAQFYLRNLNLALEDATSFLKTNPGNESGLILSSAANLFLRNYSQSLNECQKALKVGQDSDAYAICGLNYAMYKDDNKKALSYAEKALKLDPDSKGALMIKGIVYLEENMPEKALQESNKLVKMSPENPFAYTIRALASYDTDQYQQAEQDAIKSIDLYPEIPFSYYLLGQVYQKYNKKQESIKAYETAKEMFYRAGNVQKAKEAEQKLDELYTN